MFLNGCSVIVFIRIGVIMRCVVNYWNLVCMGIFWKRLWLSLLLIVFWMKNVLFVFLCVGSFVLKNGVVYGLKGNLSFVKFLFIVNVKVWKKLMSKNMR